MINLGPKMARISKLADLVRQTRYRGRWEKLLETLATVQSWSDQVDTRDSRLVEVRDFGSNPGQLRMLTYVPDHLPASAPLVVILHGCTQTAVSFDKGTGWSTLADRYGFALLLPEQHWSNNPLRCFNWFRPEDTRRDGGEALSIKQMIDRMVRDHGLDRAQVYVTGLSSGGAMTSVMLATYPDVFAGGAVVAGVPYRTADSMQEAFETIFQGRSRSPRRMGGPGTAGLFPPGALAQGLGLARRCRLRGESVECRRDRQAVDRPARRRRRPPHREDGRRPSPPGMAWRRWQAPGGVLHHYRNAPRRPSEHRGSTAPMRDRGTLFQRGGHIFRAPDRKLLGTAGARAGCVGLGIGHNRRPSATGGDRPVTAGGARATGGDPIGESPSRAIPVGRGIDASRPR